MFLLDLSWHQKCKCVLFHLLNQPMCLEGLYCLAVYHFFSLGYNRGREKVSFLHHEPGVGISPVSMQRGYRNPSKPVLKINCEVDRSWSRCLLRGTKIPLRATGSLVNVLSWECLAIHHVPLCLCIWSTEWWESSLAAQGAEISQRARVKERLNEKKKKRKRKRERERTSNLFLFVSLPMCLC